MARYGVPYMGSKNGIAVEIVNALPPGEVFVDLMAGGCAVTHAAMESGKYRRFVANDADWRGVTLFRDAINGKYRDERRLVSRDYFEANKETDAYVALCWSFGNQADDYLWNEETEGAKLRACRMVMGETWQERRAAYMDFVKYLQKKRAELAERRAKATERKKMVGDIKEYLRGALCEALRVSGKTQSEVNKHLGTQMSGHYFGRSQWAFPTREEYGKLRDILTTLPPYDAWGQDLQSLQSLESLERLERLQSLQSLERLQSLQSLERLQSLESLERWEGLLETHVGSYADVEIGGRAVVYCDPPYRGTAEYSCGEFDHEAFYDWLRTRENPVWVSEYTMPGDFVRVWAKGKQVRLSATNKSLKAVEGLWLHERWADKVVKTELF